jgi:putative tryptophan/tyrosine transport system substrate-binding protein
MKAAVLRSLVVLLAVLAAPGAGRAQTAAQLPHVGYLLLGDPDGPGRLRQAFADGLREFGYDDGRNVALDFRFAAGDTSRFDAEAQDLVHSHVAVIVTSSTAAFVSARKATSTIPIVFAAIPDPVASGFVESLSRPGRNFTGLTILSEDLNAKRLELIREIVPGAKRIGMLENPDNPSTPLISRGIEPAATSLGLTVQPFDVRGPDGYEPAFAAMAAQGVDAVLVLDDASFGSNRAALVAAAAPRKLAMICAYEQMAVDGCLCSYGINLLENFRRSGAYVAKILQGADPADLPVENPRQFRTVINMGVAEKLGLAIPDLVRLRADRLIR